jgi:hypothetical protein
MGDNGTPNGNVLRLAGGAELTCGLNATNGVVWTAIGYNQPATLTVESGSQLDCRDHLWIGFLSPSVGTVDINGGTVNVAGMFGMGWSGGTGYVNVRNGGVLDLSGLHATRSITNGSVLNLESGTVIVDGNQTGPVNDYIQAGRIVAYQGAGTLNVDYDASHPGRTTVRATAPLCGYDAWALGWGVDIGSRTNDYDHDLRSNSYEYALNGDPTNPSDLGVDPVLQRANGAVWYIHLQRNDDTNLIYSVETCTNLASTVWINSGSSVLGTNVAGGAFDEVTNSIITTAPQRFIRLKIEGL